MAATYTVKKGDTLSKIARNLGLPSYQVLAQANSLDNPNAINIGQVLNVPGSGDVAPSAPATGIKMVERDNIIDPITGLNRNAPGAAAANEAQALLAADPAYQAYLRAAGVQEQEIQGELQFRIDQTNKQISRRAAASEFNKEEDLRGVDTKWDARGLQQSGMRIAEQSRAATGADIKRLEGEAVSREGLASAQLQYDQQLSSLSRDRAEREVSAREAAFNRVSMGAN